MIANWKYDESKGYAKLKSGPRDVNLMQKIMKGLGLKVKVVRNLSSTEMKKFFKDAFPTGKTVLFYYSGHGRTFGNEVQLIGTDGIPVELSNTFLNR
eukprot:UN07451